MQEETEEARRSMPISQGRDRFHLRQTDLPGSDRDFRPLTQREISSPAFPPSRDPDVADEGRFSNRGDSVDELPAGETPEDTGYYPDDDGYMPGDNEFAGHVEAEESSQMNPDLPSPRHATDIRPPLSQALATDEIAQVRREVDRLGKKLRASETERDRLIEEVKTHQAETNKVFRERHVEAIHELKATYEKQLQASRSESSKTIAALKSEHAEVIEALKAEFASFKSGLDDGLQAVRSEQAGLIKTLQEENERLRQSTQASAQTAEPTNVEETVDPEISEQRECSQDTESLASVLSRRPEGISFPTLGLRPPVVRLPASGDGTLAGRSRFAREGGFGDSAYKQF
ncbi:uncharacterized protein FPRO_10334 [Fusarium proliferatum ET1]|uniref:Uncharacterized protein n=1 Tax=Fusarium proliferatum (strain ET1) TaxID=1227346 RepID=A0A1L7VLH3_FUSPR|nr:uncharacterized protein FPRO_10334 [Fusarium proliferatum ET1]CZR40746.1 uncharacterized protein FPRO_10334 [Fusarium proliferatum ET1]